MINVINVIDVINFMKSPILSSSVPPQWIAVIDAHRDKDTNRSDVVRMILGEWVREHQDDEMSEEAKRVIYASCEVRSS